MKKVFCTVMAVIMAISSAGLVFAWEGATPVKAQTPILITSAGQGPGGEIVNALVTRNRISPSRLAARAGVEFLQNTNTLIIVLSSSLKGLGAAGISINQELARLDSLIVEARNRGMLIVGAHLEGEDRRGGYDEDIINRVAHRVDYLIVRRDGNADGIFTRIARQHNIPLTYIDRGIQLGPVLVAMFN